MIDSSAVGSRDKCRTTGSNFFRWSSHSKLSYCYENDNNGCHFLEYGENQKKNFKNFSLKEKVQGRLATHFFRHEGYADVIGTLISSLSERNQIGKNH